MANLKDMEYGISSRVQTEWSNTKFSIALATTAAASTTFSMVAVHSSSEIQEPAAPALRQDYVGIVAHVVETSDPNGCLYTE
ncbi:hypothetical protein ETB97_005258 [Aspergillus alliaceus]|uniref:Uncharacterized protein n=1 Tax=Petromyces alliaceus TaxID=209559 RepID=A0A8H6E363_PETAA|nr:hypothetical protein ETB97_005258 [Aspergillus burnettii]